MRRGKFSANFENAEFLAVSVVSIVSFSYQEGFHGLRSSDLHSKRDPLFDIQFDAEKRIQIFLIVAVMGGFVVTECGRRKSKFLDIEMFFLIGPRV